jgi:hypothetical protein
MAEYEAYVRDSHPQTPEVVNFKRPEILANIRGKKPQTSQRKTENSNEF